MIQLTPQMRILVAVKPVDFRKGINGLYSTCREKINIDPFSGYVFVFRNKRSTSIKILVYDLC
jgi:transposase